MCETRLNALVAETKAGIEAEATARKAGDAYILSTMERAMGRLRREALANFGTAEDSGDDSQGEGVVAGNQRSASDAREGKESKQEGGAAGGALQLAAAAAAAPAQAAAPTVPAQAAAPAAAPKPAAAGKAARK
jgi:hypothetical protein